MIWIFGCIFIYWIQLLIFDLSNCIGIFCILVFADEDSKMLSTCNVCCCVSYPLGMKFASMTWIYHFSGGNGFAIPLPGIVDFPKLLKILHRSVMITFLTFWFQGESNVYTVNVLTWLILPVVIRLSQRLSHACLSINNFIQWNCEWLIISVIVYLIVPYYLDNRSNSRANTCINTQLFWTGSIY